MSEEMGEQEGLGSGGEQNPNAGEAQDVQEPTAEPATPEPAEETGDTASE